jgi:lipopolysaccharide/colanic/teichoic acid biosynthesis glycosyltransferase
MNTRKLEFWILFADLVWMAGAFLAADLLRFGLTWAPDERVSIHALLPFAVVAALIWIGLSIYMPMDGFRGGWKFSRVFSHIFFGTCCTTAVLLTAGYLARSYVSRLALAYFILLFFGGFLFIRCAARSVLRWRHRNGDLWRVVILGGGRVAQEVATKIEQHPEMLCKVVGLLFPNECSEELIVPGAAKEKNRQLSTLDIIEMLRSSRVNEVIAAFAQSPTPELLSLMDRIRDAGIETTLVPQSYELYASRPQMVTLDGLPLVQLRDPGLRRRYVVMKRWLDLGGATMLSVPAVLLLAPLAAILLLKKGHAFRWEQRCGQFGTAFRMLRLNVDRPADSASLFERLLDYLSLTELPQLWNVLRGQMSLVGPRPDPISRVGNYSSWQQRRLKVKPGMTGLAQVHGLREFSSAEQKTRFDLQYVVDPYLLLDVSLLLQTVWTLLLRVLPRHTRHGAFDVSWKPALSDDVMTNAHSTQPSSD